MATNQKFGGVMIVCGWIAGLTVTYGQSPRELSVFDPILLLSREKVQVDLRLSPQVRQTIQGIERQIDRQSSEDFENRAAGKRGYQAITTATAGMGLHWRDERIKQLKTVKLTEIQQRRLQQIHLQVLGIEAFGDAAVVDRCKLTPEQVKQLTAAQPALRTAKDVYNLQPLLDLLTAEQQTQWRAQIGPRFAGLPREARPAGTPAEKKETP